MTDRLPVSDRIRAFDQQEGSGQAPRSLTNAGGSKRAKEDSSTRQKRADQKRNASPTHGSLSSAGQVQLTSGSNQYNCKSRPGQSRTTNQALNSSFGLSSASKGYSSLNSPLTSPTEASGISATQMGKPSTDQVTSTANTSAGRKVTVTTVATVSKPQTAPQKLHDTCDVSTQSIPGTSRPTPAPQNQKRPENMYLPSRHSFKRAGQLKDDSTKAKPMVGVHGIVKNETGDPASPTIKSLPPTQSHTPPLSLSSHSSQPASPPLSMPYSHENLLPSPPCSDDFPINEIPSGTDPLSTPMQVSECSVGTKFVASGQKSLQVDPDTGNPVGSREIRLTRETSTTSTGSGASDKMVGLEDSIPMGVAMGDQKITSSIVTHLREQNDRLKKQVSDLLGENALLQELVEGNVDRQTRGEIPSSEEFLSSCFSSVDEQDVGGAKIVTNRTSMDTDERGNPRPQAARSQRHSRQEQDLIKQIESLKAHLAVKRTEVDTLIEQNDRKEATIATLKKTVATKDLEKRRGYHTGDVDDYLQQVTDLASQLSALEEKEQASAKKVTELEQQLSKSRDVARMTRKLNDEKKKLKLKVEELTASLEVEKSRQSVSSDLTTPMAEGSWDTRVMSLEAAKVPELEKQVEGLKRKLEDAKGFEEAANTSQDQLLAHIKEISEKEEEVRKLKVKITDLEEENISVSTRLQGDQLPRLNSDPSLITQSELYQILLQESQSKDEQIRQLQKVMDSEDHVKMDLEMKAQELQAMSATVDSKTAELNSKTAELALKTTEIVKKDHEIRKLSSKLQETERLNKKLRDHVTANAAAVALPSAQNNSKTEVLHQGSQQAMHGDGEKKIDKALKKIEEQRVEIAQLSVHVGHLEIQKAEIAQLKEQIEHLEQGRESMTEKLNESQKNIDQLYQDRTGMIDHSKRQSTHILELKSQVDKITESNHQLQADRTELDFQLRKLTAERTDLDSKLKKSIKQGQQTCSDVEQSQQMIHDLKGTTERLRGERNELRQVVADQSHEVSRLTEVDRLYQQCQQKIVAQQAILENNTKELGDLRPLRQEVSQLTDTIHKQQTELQKLARRRDELLGEMEAYKQTIQAYKDDFQAERKDREKAHSKIAEVETRYTHQATSLANELQIKAEELKVAVRANADLNMQLRTYRDDIGRLQEEVQSKTQQVKQYKKQVDQYKDQLEASQDQAAILKAQVESSVNRSDELEEQNKRLQEEKKQLLHRVQSGSVNTSTSSHNQQQQEQLAKHLEEINELNLKNGMLMSEIEELRKPKGVATSQTPTTRPVSDKRMPQNRQQMLSNQAMRPPPHPHSSQGPHTPQSSQGPHYTQAGPPTPMRAQLSPQYRTQSVDDSHLPSHSRYQGPNYKVAHTGQVDSRLNVADQRHPRRTADVASVRVSGTTHGTPYQEQDHSHGRHYPPPASNADLATGGRHHLQPDMYQTGYGSHGPASLPPSLGSPTHHDDRCSRQDVGRYHEPDVVDKDSPPSSFQSTSGGNTPAQNNARNQFANKHPAMSQSSDSYYHHQSNQGGRPQPVRPLPTPRVQADTHTGGQPHYPAGHLPQQGIQSNRPQSSTVGRPLQESGGAAATGKPLPSQMRTHSQNVYNPREQGRAAGGEHRYQQSSGARGEEVSASSDIQPNQLEKNIDNEIKQEAWRVARQGSGEESLPGGGDTIPLDPNLVCPTCGRQFRLGEIQKFKKHAGTCGK